MLLVKRPVVPDGFNKRAQDARANIRLMVRHGQRPTNDDFPDVWSDFKRYLAEAQHGRCGYCDRHVLGGDDGSVDHFRPKGRLDALDEDPANWGTQVPYSASLQGRKCDRLSETGYHWFAYSWSNYIFACGVCNEKFKRCLFPVAVHPRRCPPHPEDCRKGYEEPLLLSCYRNDVRLSEHLKFNSDGTVEAWNKSPHGVETIRTVGLYRIALCTERETVAVRVHELVDEYERAQDPNRATQDLARLGAPTREFAGVARAIVEQRLRVEWDRFVATGAATVAAPSAVP